MTRLTEQQITNPNVYSRPLALRLMGELDIMALKWSLIEIIQRHDVLRTSFPIIKGVPHQKIHSLDSIKIEIPEKLVIGTPAASEFVKMAVFPFSDGVPSILVDPPFA